MMGENDNQAVVWHTVQIDDLVPADHPLRRIRKLVNTERIRELCAPLYCSSATWRSGGSWAWTSARRYGMTARFPRTVSIASTSPTSWSACSMTR